MPYLARGCGHDASSARRGKHTGRPADARSMYHGGRGSERKGLERRQQTCVRGRHGRYLLRLNTRARRRRGEGASSPKRPTSRAASCASLLKPPCRREQKTCRPEPDSPVASPGRGAALAPLQKPPLLPAASPPRVPPAGPRARARVHPPRPPRLTPPQARARARACLRQARPPQARAPAPPPLLLAEAGAALRPGGPPSQIPALSGPPPSRRRGPPPSPPKPSSRRSSCGP